MFKTSNNQGNTLNHQERPAYKNASNWRASCKP